ncbi:hypothetical protein ACFL21_00970 [Patescibacteria group bacterium]
MTLDLRKKNIGGSLRTLEELLMETSDEEDLIALREELLEIIESLNDRCFFDEEVQGTLNRIIQDNQEKLQLYYLENALFDEDENREDFELEDPDFQQVEVVDLNTIFVPSGNLPNNSKDKSTVNNSDRIPFDKEVFPKLTLVYEVLNELGIINIITFRGCNSNVMVRDLSYEMLVLPELNKTILICEELANRTFVCQGILNLPEFYNSTKEDLKKDPNVCYFYWCEQKLWKEKLKRVLLDDFMGGNLDEVKIKEMDVDYFRKDGPWQADLLRFSEVIGCPIERLTTSKKYAKEYARCSNGSFIQFKSFLYNAMMHIEGVNTLAQALKKLKAWMGVEGMPLYEMNQNYFSEEGAWRKDFQAYAKAAGVEIIQLAINMKIRVRCQNNERPLFQSYLLRASKNIEGVTTRCEALRFLKGLMGCKEMDLENFDKLHSGRYYSEKIRDMDQDYFDEQGAWRIDLENYAKKAGVNIEDLSAFGFKKLRIRCRNGSTLFFPSFLSNAQKCIDGIKTRGEALNYLKELMGIEIQRFREMDQDYFSDWGDWRIDLFSFAEEANCRIDQLSTGPKYGKVRTKCSNGESSITFQTFLRRAKKLMQGVDTVKAALDKMKFLYSQTN